MPYTSPPTPVEQFYTETDGATITFNRNNGMVQDVEITDDRTLAVANMSRGERLLIKIIQDGSGNHTVTWWETIRWAGGSEPTLTTAGGKADYIAIICTGVDTYDGFVLALNV